MIREFKSLSHNRRLAVTGHTSGLGQAIYQLYPSSVGFSRSNGYDISNADDRARIINQSSQCDVFVNNAYAGNAQIDLLYELFANWHDSDRFIINISSNSGDGIKPDPNRYAVYKSALDKASQQLTYRKSRCKICNLRFGWLDTPRVAHVTDAKISMADACDVVQMVLSGSASGMITEMTVLPKAQRLL